MGFISRVNTWVSLLSLLVAIIALAFTGFTYFTENAHYQEVTKPHTQHDEIYDRLVILDNKIDRVERSINAVQGSGLEFLKDLMETKELRDQAELAWDTGNYPEADKLISELGSQNIRKFPG